MKNNGSKHWIWISELVWEIEEKRLPREKEHVAPQSAIALDTETSDKTPFNKIHMVITFVFLVALYFCRFSFYYFQPSFLLSEFFWVFFFIFSLWFIFLLSLLCVCVHTQMLLMASFLYFVVQFRVRSIPFYGFLQRTALGRNLYYCFHIVLHSFSVCVVLSDFNKEFFCIKHYDFAVGRSIPSCTCNTLSHKCLCVPHSLSKFECVERVLLFQLVADFVESDSWHIIALKFNDTKIRTHT